MQDGAQDVLVVAALQDYLHVPLQQPGLCEELGFGSKRLRDLRSIRLPLERGALQQRGTQSGHGLGPKNLSGEVGNLPGEEGCTVPSCSGCSIQEKQAGSCILMLLSQVAPTQPLTCPS